MLKSALFYDKLALYFPYSRSLRFTRRVGSVDIPKVQFLQALDLLNEKLKQIDHPLTFLCVGGGAMMLSLGARQATHDLDGVLDPNTALNETIMLDAASEVSEELNLAPDWINTQVKYILDDQNYSPADFDSPSEYQWSHLKLRLAKPGLLLAMKCQAMRKGRKDFHDIVVLIQKLSLRTVEDLVQEVKKYGNFGAFRDSELVSLKLAIAWAFPGSTEYEYIRQNALERYRKVKS
jgi:ADP-ribose pyrophosphatase YjhB (NUDIX family)